MVYVKQMSDNFSFRNANLRSESRSVRVIGRLKAGVTVEQVAFDAPWNWLARGWRDLWTVPRVSLTLPVFNAAREVVFLVAGADKVEAIGRAFGDAPDAASPAAHVRPSPGRLVLVCDEAAAAGLRGRGRDGATG